MRIEKGNLIIGLDEFVEKLTDDQKAELLEVFTMNEILPAIERQLKHETMSDWWSSSGERDGAKIREWIASITGLEEELRKDMEAKLRSVTNDRDNYKKYHDWYWDLYHYKGDNFDKKFVKEAIRKFQTVTAQQLKGGDCVRSPCF